MADVVSGQFNLLREKPGTCGKQFRKGPQVTRLLVYNPVIPRVVIFMSIINSLKYPYSISRMTMNIHIYIYIHNVLISHIYTIIHIYIYYVLLVLLVL